MIAAAILLFSQAGFLATSLFTADHFLQSLGALVSALAGWIAYKTKQATTAPTPEDKPDNLYDMTRQSLDTVMLALDRIEHLSEHGGSYQHERNHDILNELVKVSGMTRVILLHLEPGFFTPPEPPAETPPT